ncbi:hypothetical protein ACOZ38_21605 [Sphaerisporangium viridialbum]|uniref:hypothetical protein n=1 Tax=Sphaerisporangium viridialbum TaxID=46189 RepID=UPI003C730310
MPRPTPYPYPAAPSPTRPSEPVALAAIASGYALVAGEWWRATRGDDSVRTRRR